MAVNGSAVGGPLASRNLLPVPRFPPERVLTVESIREARLLEEYRELYPDLTPGVWVPASVLSEFILERGLYQRRTGTPSHARLLGEGHFEFRGGETREHQPWTGPLERRSDSITNTG